MREVIVTSGTRGSGKTSFCEKARAIDPAIVVVSRDKILMEMFGSTTLSPYSGGHYDAYREVWKAVESALVHEDVRVIFDVWNGNTGDRRSALEKLREFGADKVVAWLFVTPLEFVEQWFWQKPNIAKMNDRSAPQGKGLVFYSESAPRHDHELFHKLASGIDSDGFDEVVRINPVTMDPEDVLRLQTSLKF